MKICGGLDFNEKGCWFVCLNIGGIKLIKYFCMWFSLVVFLNVFDGIN